STPIPGVGPSMPPGPGQMPGELPGMPGPLPPGAFGQNPFGPGGPMVPGQGGFPAPKKSRTGCGAIGLIVGLFALAVVGVGVFLAVKAFHKADKAVNDALDQARDITTPGLSDKDRTA